MSKWPWPQRLNRIDRDTPSSRQRIASSIAARTAWLASGAGTMPSTRANCTPASKHLVWWYAVDRIRPSSCRCDTSGAMPW